MSQEVLIVEDDRALARKLVRIVEQAGYSTRLAHDGEAAMRAVANAAPDLVLLDLLIPKKDGRTVLTLLQSAGATRGIPVLAMSGIFRGRENARELTLAGAVGFLEKPFSQGDLLSELRKLLGPPKQAEATGSEEGGQGVSLAKRSVAELLWEAMQQGLSGAVHFRSGRHHKVVVLERGEPSSIRSNAVRECLGQRLMNSGRIDEKVLQESLRRAKNSNRKQGELLVAMGTLTRAELDKALATQGEEKLLDLFSWKEGEAWTQAGVEGDSLASPLAGWTRRGAILRGVEMMDRAWLAERLAPYSDRSVVRQKLELSQEETTPAVVALLKALGRGATVGGLVEPHAPVLYGLWLVGGVRFGDEAGPSAGGPGISADELIRVRDTYRRQTHFEVLGVPLGAPQAEVRGAFVKLAKRYHPDRFRGAPSELAALAAEIFARISSAHDTLCDSQARAAYLAELRTGKTANQQRKEVARIVSAEQECRKGEDSLKAREYERAVSHFQRALELSPDEGEFHAFYGWSLFLTKPSDPKTRKEAVEHLKKALSLAPASPTGYYYLGQMQKACGDPDQAVKMFRKVLSLRRNHVEASRELRLLKQRGRQRNDSTSGMFGFGRKKK